jgi:tetratricopeptide (TPR) repeat protein/DNA-binding CsgD family transcriptional regulator
MRLTQTKNIYVNYFLKQVTFVKCTKLLFLKFSLFIVLCCAYNSVKSDTLLVNRYLSLAWKYKRNNTDSTFYFSKLARQEALKISFKKGVALSYKMEASAWYNKGDYKKAITLGHLALKNLKEINATLNDMASTNNLIGLAHMSKGDYEDAEIFFLKAGELYKSIDDVLGEVSTIHNLGVVNFYLGNYKNAMEYYSKALKMCEKDNDMQTEADIIINIGILLNQEKQYTKAIEYYRKAFQKQYVLKDRRGMGQTLSSIGTCYFSQGNIDSSLYYHNASLDTFKRGKMDSGIAQSLNNIGDILLIQKKYNNALTYYQEALDIRLKSDERYGLAISYNNLAKVYSEQNQWSIAQINFMKAQRLSEEINSPYLLSEVFQARALMYERKGDFKNAYRDINNFHLLRDSLYDNEKSKAISELQQRYNSEKAENELLAKTNQIQLLEKEEKSTRYLYYTIVIVLLSLLFAAWQFYRTKKIALENKLLQSERDRLFHESEAVRTQANLEREVTEKQKISKELDLKKQDLIQMALYISQQNDFLENLNKNISVSKAKNHSTLALEKELEQKISLDKQREMFKLNINLINEEFYNRLQFKFPRLTDGEKKLCAMLRLNLSSKEIASIQNITSKSVDMSRYRLRKKLDVPVDIELSDFLLRI